MLATTATWFASACNCATVPASALLVDDRHTVVEWQAPPRWTGNRPHQDAVETAARAGVVLDTQHLAGQHVRIYMRLAPALALVNVAWKATAVFLPGSLQPGGRALIFQGVVGSQLRGTLDVLVSASRGGVRERTPLQFSFEAEVQR